jgi:hypothetical protein
MPAKLPNPEKVADRLGLEHVARNSFISLCEKGCVPEFLAEHLRYLMSRPTITIDRGSEKTENKRKPYKVSLRPMDDLDVALEGFEKRDLEPLKEKLLAVAKQVQKLNRTRLVRYMDEDKYETEIYRLPNLLQMYARQFIPLLLAELKSKGAKNKPNFNNYLNEICNHVKESTGKDNYKLISDVLNGLGLVDWTEGGLKQKRYRQNLGEKKQH